MHGGRSHVAACLREIELFSKFFALCYARNMQSLCSLVPQVEKLHCVDTEVQTKHTECGPARTIQAETRITPLLNVQPLIIQMDHDLHAFQSTGKGVALLVFMIVYDKGGSDGAVMVGAG